jgi:hypothetical protein
MSVSLAKVSDSKIIPALLPVALSPVVASRLGVPAPSQTLTTIAGRPVAKSDYSDGYGHEYAVGE